MSSTNSTLNESDQYNTIVNSIKKLGHELEEIRLRSLDSLLSKLEHNFITEIDLIQHRQLFINLFEFFNFPNAAGKDKVLTLLYSLANYEAAVRIIQEIGGLQFLNALKQDLPDNDLKEKITQITERLLDVSSHIVNNNESALTTTNSNETANFIRKLSSLNTFSNNNDRKIASLSSASTATIAETTLNTERNNYSLKNYENSYTVHPSVPSHVSQQKIESSFQKQAHQSADGSNIGQVFSQTINSQDLNSQLRFAINDSELHQIQNYNSTIFCWIPLTSFDRNFLQNALNSIKSNDIKKIKSYCTFLQNMVFNDFPVEIFLQRSEIIKALFDLLITTPDDDLTLSIISCLHTFCIKLKKRVTYIKDPSTFCIKDFYGENNIESLYAASTATMNMNTMENNSNQNHVPQKQDLNLSVYSQHSSVISTIKSTDSNRQPTGRGAVNRHVEQPVIDDNDNVRQDLQVTMDTIVSESHPENYETDLNQKQNLQANELQLHIFCLKLLDILFDSVAKSSSLLPNIFETINNLFVILHESKAEWSPLNLSQVLMNLFQKLNYHLRHWYAKEPSNYNRTVYVFLVNILCNIINLMHSTNETSLLLPSELTETLFAIINDICLNEAYEQQINLLIPLLNHLDTKLFDVYSLSNQICDSLNDACNFLIKYDSLINKDPKELIRLARSSLNCLDYHTCKLIPQYIVLLCSKQMQEQDFDKLHDNSPHNVEVEGLLCDCMRSNCEQIRIDTYSQITKIVAECLSIDVACETKSKRYKRLKFLLLKSVFYEFISFGLFDTCAKIKEYSKTILLHLLQCELLVSIEFHESLSSLFAMYMPFVQCEATQIEKLGQLVIQLSDDTREQLENGILLPTEKLKTALRYMFSKDKNIRKVGYRQAVGFIIKDYKSDDKDIIGSNLNEFYLQYSPDKYADVLVKLKKMKVFHENDDSIFQADNLVRIYNIFASDTVDIEVKKNACEQLAIMISDSKLHKAFINLGGLDYCINLLRNAAKQFTNVKKENDNFFIINASCLTCICNIFYWNKEIRQKYAFDTQFYKLMFKYLIIFNSQLFQSTSSNILLTVQEDLSSILFMLLFHEISSIDRFNEDLGVLTSTESQQRKQQQQNQFKLNSVILKYFTHTFEILECKRQLIDKNLKFNSIFKSLDANTREILNAKFRLYWNMKWHGGTMERLIEDLLYNANMNDSRAHIEFSENLVLTDKDKLAVKSTNPYYLFKQLFDAINHSTTHQDALLSLDLIQVLLLIDPESKHLKDLNWHHAMNRFASIIPKSSIDQMLFSRIFQTLSKIIDNYLPFDCNPNFIDIDDWLTALVNDTDTSCFLIVFKRLCDNFENDELHISPHLNALCKFIKSLFRKSDGKKLQANQIFPSELINYCMQHIRACETIKFRNLNKLSIILEIFAAVLNTTQINDIKLQIQLVKSLVQIINSFHVGRGGLSLSFMGNTITKSATLCLLEAIYSLFTNQNQLYKIDLLKTLLCVKDECSSLCGSSWLVPLLLNREPQIRSMSFSITSLIVTVPYGRTKLLAYQNGIWSIALNVLLNRFESSIVRIEACSLLVNLLKALINEDELNMSITGLQLILQEHNFFSEIAILLTSFYPYDTYSLDAIVSSQNQNIARNNLNLTMHTINNNVNMNDVTISSPLLICSITQLLYNLTILLPEETLLNINNNGILRLLISYVKPTLVSYDNIKLQYENLIDMLKNICNYLMLCCMLEKNCIVMFAKEENFITDLIECLNVDGSKTKLKHFYSSIFDLLGIFLNFDDTTIVNHIINSLLKRWNAITYYLLEILSDTSVDNDLLENTLKFYSIYLSKITLGSGDTKNYDTISFIYDVNVEQRNNGDKKKTLGAQLCDLLIRQFDKHCLSEQFSNVKLSVYNTLRALLVLSTEAKNTALEAGFIETLVEHLKDTHVKLNLRSLNNSKTSLKENTFIIDLKQILLVIKSFMCYSNEIKDEFAKYSLHSIIHSFWCWALQDQNLLLATLSTLSTYTANNKQAVVSLTQSTNLIISSTANISEQTTRGSCLLQSIIKIISKFNAKYQIQKYGFGILINCAQVSESKAVISKSNLLHEFITDVQQKINNKPNLKKEKLWLQFLTSLSFTNEGQNIFMKIEGFLSCIIKCMDGSVSSTNELQYYGLLILRNLAFNQSNKSKLLSHSDYLNALISYLQHKDEKFIKLSISALDSLLYDYQKARVALKTANVIQYLVDLIGFFKKKNDNQTLYVLNNLIKVLNE